MTAMTLKKKKHRKQMSDIVFDSVVILILVLFSLCIVFPFMNLISISMSSEIAIQSGKVGILPNGFSLNSYKRILETSAILRSFGITIFVSCTSVATALIANSIAAYPLAFGHFPGKKIYNFLLMFTMWFSGGMIPTFLVMRALGLIDSLMVLVWNTLLSAYNILILSSFFRSIPTSLVESAYLDGASDWKVLFRIILPLAKPGLATVGLWIFVGHWNDYMNPLVYIRTVEKYPLQMVLRELVLTSVAQSEMLELTEGNKGALPEQLKHAVIVFSMLPIMIMYPFVQKYFVKGIMLGSVKE